MHSLETLSFTCAFEFIQGEREETTRKVLGKELLTTNFTETSYAPASWRIIRQWQLVVTLTPRRSASIPGPTPARQPADGNQQYLVTSGETLTLQLYAMY